MKKKKLPLIIDTDPGVDDTLAMMKAKNRLLMIDIYMNQGMNACCKPSVRSSGERMWPI